VGSEPQHVALVFGLHNGDVQASEAGLTQRLAASEAQCASLQGTLAEAKAAVLADNDEILQLVRMGACVVSVFV
jgi:hypothetical protein